jgi:hypothetical protein
LTITLSAVLVVLAMLACNAPGQETTVPPTATLPEAGEASPTPSQPAEPPPGPTDTPAPDVTAPSGCTLNAAFAQDVTVPDNTEMEPGQAFIKTWRLRNTGTCDWEAGTVLAFSSGERMDGPDSVAVGAVEAGATVEVSVDLTAPPSPGTYRGNWQLETPEGTRFGSIIYVQIVVPAPATATPTRTPTPTVTPTGGCVAVDPALEPILDLAEAQGYDLGCPTAGAFETWAALQQFWANIDHVNPHMHFRSLMIWREDNAKIYVIDGTDTDASEGSLMIFTDTWDEGQPELPPACEDMTVPDGYQMPIRGFGKVWCNNDLVDLIGWPDVGEQGATFLVQPTENGLLMRAPVAPIGYLLALDLGSMHGVTSMISP